VTFYRRGDLSIMRRYHHRLHHYQQNRLTGMDDSIPTLRVLHCRANSATMDRTYIVVEP